MGIEHLADEIEQVAQERGIDRDSAAIFVAMRHGDLVGDVLCLGPLTDEEKRRRRRTLREVMIELGELDEEPQDSEETEASTPDEHGHRIAR